jgi:hypothetical protein
LGPVLARDRHIHCTAQLIQGVANGVVLTVDVQEWRGTVAGHFIFEQLALLLIGAVLDGLVQAQAGVLVGSKYRRGYEQQ